MTFEARLQFNHYVQVHEHNPSILCCSCYFNLSADSSTGLDPVNSFRNKSNKSSLAKGPYDLGILGNSNTAVPLIYPWLLRLSGLSSPIAYKQAVTTGIILLALRGTLYFKVRQLHLRRIHCFHREKAPGQRECSVFEFHKA